MNSKLLTLVLCLAGFGATYAQPSLRLTAGGNSYCAGDSLYKYRVEYKIRAVPGGNFTGILPSWMF